MVSVFAYEKAGLNKYVANELNECEEQKSV